MNTTRNDLLVHRALEGNLAGSDWRELESLAAVDPGLWRRLALCWRDQAALERSVASTAERVPATVPPGNGRSLLSWGGWLAAAASLLVWLALPRAAAPVEPVPRLEAGPAEVAAVDPDRVLERYRQASLASGRLVQEYPVMLMDQRPAPDGKGFEVLYLRRLLEREVVDQVYEYHPDDAGQPVAVPVRTVAARGGERL